MTILNECFRNITSPAAILSQAEAVLSQLDPNFDEIHSTYLSAVEMATAVYPEEAKNYLLASNTALSQELLYLFCAGLQLNAECFYHPVNAEILEMDFEVIYQEYKMAALPAIVQARTQASTAAQLLPTESLTPICDYFAYWETVGWKLAHLLGYLLGNQLFVYLIPGYIPNQLTTIYYRKKLSDYLQIHFDRLV